VSRLFVELYDHIEDGETGARGVVVMGSGPAEVSHHAVAQIVRDVAIEAGNRFGGRAIIPRDRLAPFLGIELCGDRGRTGEVTEQHRQMTPLAIAAASPIRRIVADPNVRYRVAAGLRSGRLGE
jgi:hypothetical protein